MRNYLQPSRLVLKATQPSTTQHLSTPLRNVSPKPSQFHSAATRRHPVSKTTMPHLLYRDPDRPLPSLATLSVWRRWAKTMPIFLVICTASALGLFNYQKLNSPIVTANMYSLRTNDIARQMLGDQIYFANSFAWIHGTINLVSGYVDISFAVKGTKASGVCVFKAIRKGGKSGKFETTEWSLKMDGAEEKLELLEQRGLQNPMLHADM